MMKVKGFDSSLQRSLFDILRFELFVFLNSPIAESLKHDIDTD
jgi:hypothetical protein